MINFTFVLRDGTHKNVQAHVGQHILEIAKQNDVELEGACEASLACSTCHVILPENVFNSIEPGKD
jgi:ferredoxin